MKIEYSVTLTILIALMACSPELRTIEFILPNDFEGLVDIRENQMSETVIQKSETKYLLEIPKSGRIEVQSMDPFFKGRFIPEPRFKNGRKVTVRPVQDKGARGVNFWLISQPMGRQMHYFVGTRQDLESYDFANPDIYLESNIRRYGKGNGFNP